MSALPDCLDTVRKLAEEALRPLMGAACGATDDAFFDLSQNGPEDEQSVFFSAMREMRLKRQEIIDAVLAGVDQDFYTLTREKIEEKKTASEFSLDSLTLLDDDALDISVAFQGMGARSRDALGTELDHLRQRVDRVLARELPADRLPLHPERICEHFRLAIEPMQLPIKARLILIKHFERQVLGALGEVLGKANESLAKAGFLPEIKAAKARPSPSRAGAGGDRGSKSAKRSARRGHDDDEEDEEDEDDDRPRRRSRGGGGDDFAAMSGAFAELLALARGALVPAGAAPGAMMAGMVPASEGGQGMVLPPGMVPIHMSQLPVGQMPVMYGGQMMVGTQVVQSDVPVQVMAPAELANLLTQLQRLQQAPSLQPAGPSDDVKPGSALIEHADLVAVDVKSGLSELIRGDDASAPRALDSGDNDVINLVSMLFDFILDDADLSSEIKALIGRLQIPLLKVSLLDKTFFERDDHPARGLLNALARAGVGWNRETDDGLYAKVESIVYRILNEFTDDISIFAQLDAELARFVAEREKRMAMIEARLRDREEGQARGALAQKQVRAVMAARIAGRRLPPEVLVLIQEGWQRVLHQTAIREGVESDLWQQRVKVLEVLVWCAVSHAKEEARVRQRAIVPRLLVNLQRGLDAVGFDRLKSQSMLAALQPVLESIGAGNETRTLSVVTEAPSPLPSTSSAETAPAATADALQVLRRSEEEVVIAAPVEPEATPEAAVDERWLQTADSLAPGTWIEFHDSENNFTLRGKIAARIRTQNKYIFVNGRGAKIAEKTIDQLARDLQTGVARLVSDAALFDRALETMISRLKSGVPG